VTEDEVAITLHPGHGAPGRPTELCELLGLQLRHLRVAKGVTRQVAGKHIRASASKISRIELGRVTIKAEDLQELLTLYGVTESKERQASWTWCGRRTTGNGGTSTVTSYRPGSARTWRSSQLPKPSEPTRPISSPDFPKPGRTPKR
jgi:transcriptional regulator with XRE-family HTH domain